jgi:hypothetical protein
MDEQATPAAAYGLRLGVWYATLFIAGSLTIVYLTYVLTSASLAQRDRQIIDSKLGTYVAAYDNGGIEELASVVRAEQRAPERLFVRVLDRGSEISSSASRKAGTSRHSKPARSVARRHRAQVGKHRGERRRPEAFPRRAQAGHAVDCSSLTGSVLATQSALRLFVSSSRRATHQTYGRTDKRYA